MCLCAGRTAELKSKQRSGVKGEAAGGVWWGGDKTKPPKKTKKTAALVRRVGGEQSVALLTAVFATGLVR